MVTARVVAAQGVDLVAECVEAVLGAQPQNGAQHVG
jgi:hypothetical protein